MKVGHGVVDVFVC